MRRHEESMEKVFCGVHTSSGPQFWKGRKRLSRYSSHRKVLVEYGMILGVPCKVPRDRLGD